MRRIRGICVVAAMILVASLTVASVGEPPKKSVYIPMLKSPSFNRTTSMQITEVVKNGIQSQGAYTVVGSPDEADLILEMKLSPRVKADAKGR